MKKIRDLNIKNIENLIPHRKPMLLIEKLTDIIPMESATGIMNITKDNFFFNGHFPGQPVMPGVLIVEAFGQTAATLTSISLSSEVTKNKLVYLMTINKAQFRKPIMPDCILELKVRATKIRSKIWAYEGSAFVNKELMANAEWMATIVDKND